MGNLSSTKSSQTSGLGTVTVKYCYMIVCTFLVLLQLKVLEDYFNSLAIHCGKMPHAVFPTWVKVGPIGTANFTRGHVDLVLTTTWFKKKKQVSLVWTYFIIALTVYDYKMNMKQTIGSERKHGCLFSSSPEKQAETSIKENFWIYSGLSLSRLRLFRITASLEEKIWSLF